MLTAFVPVLSESSALGADRYFDYRIENYAEALSLSLIHISEPTRPY